MDRILSLWVTAFFGSFVGWLSIVLLLFGKSKTNWTFLPFQSKHISSLKLEYHTSRRHGGGYTQELNAGPEWGCDDTQQRSQTKEVAVLVCNHQSAPGNVSLCRAAFALHKEWHEISAPKSLTSLHLAIAYITQCKVGCQKYKTDFSVYM